ncbi:MAG: DNA polymerase III subunit alpha [Oligoflexia bacterium]|nr:DNA polymerase III subunit alpha [Oligoflexia bacterium]
MGQFAHLHLHTQYSLLDGLNKISPLIEKVQRLGHPAVAITDHGNLHGAVEFYQAAKSAGINPIIGCELYVTDGSRLDRRPKSQGGAGTYHITCLARNLSGYRNLCKLVSLAFKEGFYFKPRVDHELLEALNGDLIVLSGCLGSELGQAALNADEDRAKKIIEFYTRTFKDRYYLEVQPHPVKEQQALNEICATYGRKYGVPLVATTDCHYLNEGDHFAQEVLMCISTGTQVTDPNRMRHEGVKLYLKSADEMLAEFGDASFAAESIDNAGLVASQCAVDFDFSTYYMPRFPTEAGKTLDDAMEEAARAGLKRRLEVLSQISESWSSTEARKYEDRLTQEIAMIKEMGFSGYFLICADFIVWAKEHGIPVGPGRGSAAGSLVAYTLRITDIDPIQHKLLFERFLNPKRVSLPDIDVDFCIFGRDQVIDYVVSKYGEDHVAQIATFGTLKAKAAIKDVGRALGKSFAEMDKIAQLVPPPRQGFDYPLTEALKMEKRLADYAATDGRELIDLALHVEGLTRHASTHAAGVVIGDRPLVELLPMMVDKDGKDVTQYSMKYVEKCGLLKFDFLGLKTLTVIHTAVKIIEESRGVKIELERLPIEDPKTYALLCAGNTTGVFQLESTGITEMTMRLKPSCFDDLVAILALYRPGPLDAGMVDHYIERKHGREPVTYPIPLMKNILSDTYGIILYQEQIMQLAQALAGYSLGEADLLRRAMGKKNPEEMKKQGERFISGAVAQKIDKRKAVEVFDQMETFARYGFNRSHSAAYAMISFQTGYLKAHYPVEFMAALMSHEMDDSDKTLKNLTECRKQKISILPPDVNKSSSGFSVVDGCVRFGLSAIKGIGDKAVQAIEEQRNAGGPFKDLTDLVTRVDMRVVNKRVVESLIKCGALDSSGDSRRGMLESLEETMRIAASEQRDRDTNQISLFGGSGGTQPAFQRRAVKVPEWPINKKLMYEREALGFYISGHPLEKYQRVLKTMGTVSTSEVKAKVRSSQVLMAGVVTALKLKNTKKGDRYASFALEDTSGAIDALVWPDVYKQCAHILTTEEPVLVKARPDVTDERSVIIVEAMQSLIEVRDRKATQGLLTFENVELQSRADNLMSIFSKHTGTCPVKVRMMSEGKEIWITLKDRKDAPVMVVPSEALCEEVEQLFGRPVLSFV